MANASAIRTGRGIGTGTFTGPAAAGAAVLWTAPIAALPIIGLLLRDRTPALDSWGMANLRVAVASPTEAIVELLSDGLRVTWVLVAAVAVGWLLRRDGRPAALPAAGYLLLFLTLAASSEILKDVFGRPHPFDPTDVSYPSTHVAMVTVAAIIAAAVAVRGRGRPDPALVGLIAASVVVTAATRVLLGEHHLTDVAGTAAGYAGAAMLGVWLLRPRNRPVDSRAPAETG